MNAAECHYRLQGLMEAQRRLLDEVLNLAPHFVYGKMQDRAKLGLARIHMERVLTELHTLDIDLEQVLHIALAQEVEDKHARASELKS
jgi:hypothetical protein